MNLNNHILDVKYIIDNNLIDNEYNVIKSLEDTIINIYKSNSNSELLKDNLLLLNDIKDNKFEKIKVFNDINIDSIKNLELEDFILDELDNIVFTGSYIRSIFLSNNSNDSSNLDEKVEKELFITFINYDFNYDLLKESYIDTCCNYYKKINNKNDIIIYINKDSCRSVSECLLLNDPFKRCGFYKDRIYVSNMFIIEYYRNINILLSELKDPIFNTPYDPFDIYNKKKNKQESIFDIIDKKNYNEFKDKYQAFTTKKLYSQLKNGLTCIEYALYLYIGESCDYIKENLINIIIKLNDNEYFRHCYYYANIIKLKDINVELYDLLKLNNFVDIYNFNNINNINNIDEFNDRLIYYYIDKDDDSIYSYLININKKLDKKYIEYIINKKPDNIINKGINYNYISEYNLYKIILLSEKLDYFNILKTKINIDILVNFLDDIINNCLVKSFYFVYKLDNTIINNVDENNNTVLHKLKDLKNLDILSLIIKLNKNVLYIKNNDGYNPLMLYINSNNLDIVIKLFNLIFEINIFDIFNEYDNDNDTIIHSLTKFTNNHDIINIIKKILKYNPTLLNIQNNKGLTPIMLSAINKNEELFYYLKSLNPDMNICDIYGNTVYHYICLNEIAIGMSIDNKVNHFGYTPMDYCRISNDYYFWIKN